MIRLLLRFLARFGEPKGRHRLPARSAVRGEGTASDVFPVPEAVPLYPRNAGDGHIRVEDNGDVTVRAAWVTWHGRGEHPYPWAAGAESSRRLYDALRELPEVRP